MVSVEDKIKLVGDESHHQDDHQTDELNLSEADPIFVMSFR